MVLGGLLSGSKSLAMGKMPGSAGAIPPPPEAYDPTDMVDYAPPQQQAYSDPPAPLADVAPVVASLQDDDDVPPPPSANFLEEMEGKLKSMKMFVVLVGVLLLVAVVYAVRKKKTGVAAVAPMQPLPSAVPVPTSTFANSLNLSSMGFGHF